MAATDLSDLVGPADDAVAAARRPALILLAAGALLALPAQAENTVSYQTFKYVEAGDRISVVAGDLSIEKDFGTDVTTRLDLGYDGISGATPDWKAKPGYANEYVSGTSKVASEMRNALGAGLTWRDSRRNEYSFGASSSREPDFLANELSAQAMLWDDELHNRSYTLGLGLQRNTSVASTYTNNTEDRHNTAWNLQFGVNQVLDRSNTLEVSTYAGRDAGYLSNHYLKIVRDDGFGQHSLADDSRPERRRSGGVALRWITAWQADLKSNLWYRHYRDDWGIQGHTVEAKLYWDLSEQWRLNPVLRLHKQSAADFYRAYGDAVNTFAATGFGSNDARLGALRATTAQLNAEYHADKDWTLNAGLSHYRQDTGLSANWVTLGFVHKY